MRNWEGIEMELGRHWIKTDFRIFFLFLTLVIAYTCYFNNNKSIKNITNKLYQRIFTFFAYT